MRTRPCPRLYAFATIVAAALLAASPASAQFQPRPVGNDLPTGEQFHIEGGIGLWLPSADMSIASTQFGIIGSRIDFKQDLGVQDQKFPEFHLTLRPARKHKFRLQYIPIKYEQLGTVQRDIIFNGQRYRIGLPVNSALEWNALRLGYEYDFIATNRGFGGFVLDFKMTDVTARLASQFVNEFAHAEAPIPAIGGIFRVYAASNISITGEITAFKLPDTLIERTTGHYVDMDFYGTVNFTNNVGARFGYRSLDVGYVVKSDSGNFKLKGIYFGVVARY
jgi:hypothetical protein